MLPSYINRSRSDLGMRDHRDVLVQPDHEMPDTNWPEGSVEIPCEVHGLGTNMPLTSSLEVDDWPGSAGASQWDNLWYDTMGAHGQQVDGWIYKNPAKILDMLLNWLVQ